MIAQGLITYPTTVDDPTKVLIFDWFQYREVCDNDKFNTFFNRTLNASMRKYRELLRIQPGETLTFDDGTEKIVTYDWLVQSYREMQHTINEESTSSETSTGENGVTRETVSSGTKTSAMTGEDVTDRDTTSSTSSTSDTTSTSSGTDSHTGSVANGTINEHSGSDESDDKTLSKSSPQSISYSGVTGVPNNLDWTYPGAQSEVKHSGSDSSEDTNSSTSVSSDSGNTSSSSTSSGAGAQAGIGTEDTTFNTERNTTDADSRIDTVSETGENSITKDGNTAHDSIAHEIAAGRSLDIATLLDNAKNFILSGSAWDYLYGQLDKLFISIYND